MTFAPPHPFRQRMWAGGELLFSKNPLKVGDNVKLIKTCSNVELKRSSRKQELVFVWEDRDIYNEKGWSLKDKRGFVYRKEEEGRANSTKIVKGKDCWLSVLLKTQNNINIMVIGMFVYKCVSIKVISHDKRLFNS